MNPAIFRNLTDAKSRPTGWLLFFFFFFASLARPTASIIDGQLGQSASSKVEIRAKTLRPPPSETLPRGRAIRVMPFAVRASRRLPPKNYTPVRGGGGGERRRVSVGVIR